MENKLVVVVTHSGHSEVLTMAHAIQLHLTVTNGFTHKLSSHTVNHLPKPRRFMGDRMLSDLNNFYRIRQGFCRIPVGRNPVRISSEFDGIR
jgi:hypothetical protein